MMRRFFSPKKQIEIDECPDCGGIWLDAEELDGIRRLFKNSEDRAAATDEFVKSVMDDPELRIHQRDHDQLLGKLDGIASVLSGIVGTKL